MLLLLLLAVVLAGGPVAAAATTPSPQRSLDELGARGPHEVAVREVVIPRDDSGDGFGARLYRPLPAREADDAALSRSPVVSFGHGYLAPVELYDATLEHLASWGLTVVAPRSGGELFPDHARFADDLVAALMWVAQGGAADPAALPVDAAMLATAGHSMGGGAAVLAAGRDPRVRAAATFAAAETRPSAVAAAASSAVPMLFVAASQDRIAPVDEHQRPMFEAVAGAPAQLRTIAGAGHCGILDAAGPVGLVCGRSELEPAEQQALSWGLLTAWLRAELAGDETVAQVAWPRSDPGDGTTVEISTGGRR